MNPARTDCEGTLGKIAAKRASQTKPVDQTGPPKERQGVLEVDAKFLSPASERRADAMVERATRGLMRLQSRRRFRSVMRQGILILLILAIIASLTHYFFDDLSGWVETYWEMLESKIHLSTGGESASSDG